MELVVVGINHKTAPVELREKFSFSHSEAAGANRRLKADACLSENIILSTCNRVEIYAVANHDRDCAHDIKDFLAAFHNMKVSDHDDKLYIYKGKNAVGHLFKVASGLDSMVVGEMEILNQLKVAYRDAKSSLATGKVLNRLFEKAFNTAKTVRTETFIARGTVSVSSAASRLAKKILGDLKDKTAMIVGTGVIGEQLIVYLRKNGIGRILVANRTLERAKGLAERFDATALAFEDFEGRMAEVDIVIASTGAPHCIIRTQTIASLMPKRGQRPLFIIDLAVPRDVESQVNEIDNVYLYDIDDLQRIVDDNISLRRNELDNCSRIIDTAADRFMAWLVKEKISDEN